MKKVRILYVFAVKPHYSNIEVLLSGIKPYFQYQTINPFTLW